MLRSPSTSGWRDNAHKAVLEFVERCGKTFRYVACHSGSKHVALIMQ
ncbi:MAG TPA: hypothetical protein VFB54_10585 [Burkholderiales bacterium]|nr:hypothetical protein [Burkholderiales bacterium]